MSTETNKALVRRLFAAMSRGTLDALDELLSPHFISHEELPPGISPGREGAKQLFALLRGAFPDLHATIQDEIAEGDRVAVRVEFSGTHHGEFMGIPPTGRRVAYGVIDVLRIDGGQVVEHWGVADMFGLMRQLSAPVDDRVGRTGAIERTA